MNFFLLAIFVIFGAGVLGQGTNNRDLPGCIQKKNVLKLKKGRRISYIQYCDSCIAIEGGKVVNILNLENSVYTVEVMKGKKIFVYSGMSKVFVNKNENIGKGSLIGSLTKDDNDGLYYQVIFISDSEGVISYKSFD